MKIKHCAIKNFGSYKELELNFDNQGLTLLHGKTGSGKSTIPDMVFWLLFGETAKGGSVDDVRNWESNEPTEGTLIIDLEDDSQIGITRVRGKAADNDLFFCIDSAEETRGKDIKDTQKLLEKILGVSPILYEVSAYFHEFSSINTFFLSKAKDRRVIFEQVSDLYVPIKLANKSHEKRKLVKQEIEELTLKVNAAEQVIIQQEKQMDRLLTAGKKWVTEQESTIKSLELKVKSFESDKAMRIAYLQGQSDLYENTNLAEEEQCKVELHKLSMVVKPENEVLKALLDLKNKLKASDEETCKECGGPVDSGNRDKIISQISSVEKAAYINEKNLDALEAIKKKLNENTKKQNPYTNQLESETKKVNNFQEQLDSEKLKLSPYDKEVTFLIKEITKLRFILEDDKLALINSNGNLALLNKLYDLSFELRGVMLENTIQQVQDRTNQYMESYFDGELKVQLTLQDSDSLEVGLTKSGYECGYKQLSKGQRGLLKLCFSVAVMEAASNQSGIHFSTLFFDESLDGLDSEFKVKAFDLLQELNKSHSNIFVIDHLPEFQNLFENQIHVSMQSDISSITMDGNTPLYEPSHDEERIEST